MRCTQNATVGEEWRRGWHPERFAPAPGDAPVLVVGAGPAGLECARVLGERGYPVMLAEARGEVGGRVTAESRLPGLAAWARVRDYRLGQLARMAHVAVYPGSEMGAADVLDTGCRRVVIATGSRWRRDGVGRRHAVPVPGSDGEGVHTPDDVMAGTPVASPAVVFDDDHYYLGAVVAEKLAADGVEVTLVTPAPDVSHWCHNTLEQSRIQRTLLERGVAVATQTDLRRVGGDHVELACVFTGATSVMPCASVVMVTSRAAEDGLLAALRADPARLAGAGVEAVTAIGDCLAPSTIAAAVHDGHRYARELDDPDAASAAFNRPTTALGA